MRGPCSCSGGVVGPTAGQCHGYAENRATWSFTHGNRNQWKFAINSARDNTRVLFSGRMHFPSTDSGQSFCVEGEHWAQATSVFTLATRGSVRSALKHRTGAQARHFMGRYAWGLSHPDILRFTLSVSWAEPARKVVAIVGICM